MNENKRIKITFDMIEILYHEAKLFSKKEISKEFAVEEIAKSGMRESTSNFYLDNYICMLEGREYHKAMGLEITEYFLEHIYADASLSGLRNALLALQKNINYYNKTCKGKLIKLQKLHDKYSSLITE